jgi:hypothetical protein
MEKRIRHIRFCIFVISLLLIAGTDVYSQGIDLYRRRESKSFVGISILPGQTSIENSISNNSNFTVYNLRSSKRNSISFSLDAGYRFSKYFEFVSGIGFSSYSSGLLIDSCKNYYDAVDDDGEAYERRITGKNINEIQKISLINIPLTARFILPINEKIGIFLQTGINFSMPVSKTFTDKGTFSYTGYYKDYNLLLYDITNGSSIFSGFVSNQSVDKGGSLKTKTFSPEFISSAGIQVTLNDKVRLSFGAFYNKLLTNMSGYKTSSPFKFSESNNEINSLMGTSSNTTAKAVGIKISFVYFIK